MINNISMTKMTARPAFQGRMITEENTPVMGDKHVLQQLNKLDKTSIDKSKSDFGNSFPDHLHAHIQFKKGTVLGNLGTLNSIDITKERNGVNDQVIVKTTKFNDQVNVKYIIDKEPLIEDHEEEKAENGIDVNKPTAKHLFENFTNDYISRASE